MGLPGAEYLVGRAPLPRQASEEKCFGIRNLFLGSWEERIQMDDRRKRGPLEICYHTDMLVYGLIMIYDVYFGYQALVVVEVTLLFIFFFCPTLQHDYGYLLDI